MNNINELLGSLKQKEQKKQELYEKLEKSLALEAFLPDVFAKGKATSFWRVRRVRGVGHRKGLELLEFVVTTSSGEVRTFKPEEVPDNLKPKEAI